MGSWFSTVFGDLFESPQEFKLMIIGLDSSGKTTILYKMKLAEVVESAPTIGFNLEEIKVKNVNIKVWDLSGQEKMRNVWKHYFETVSGIVFVIDSTDRDRMPEVKDELHKILNEHQNQACPCLILGNKQDQPDALGKEELKEHLLGCGRDIESAKSNVHI
jgi:small GTP-binding protein